MKLRDLLVILLLINISIFSQVPRTVLLEYATNASCGPCAAANPENYAYLKSNYGSLVSIWYHAWWPGSGDPMYVANKTENENRIGYYSVNAVPRYIVDGVLQGYGDEHAKMRTNIETRKNMESPVLLKASSTVVGDSLNVSVSLMVLGEVQQENIKLRTAVIEQLLVYTSPPGSNGEYEFPHVFRKFIDGVNGIDISNLSIGDSLNFDLTTYIDSTWNRKNIAVVTFLQSTTSKEIIQAATDKKLHSISSVTPSFELVNKNQNINYPYSITNYYSDTLKLAIALDVVSNNENWPVTLKYNASSVDSFVVYLAPQDKVEFALDAIVGEKADYMQLTVSAKNIGEPNGFEASLNYLALVKAGDIMLIDDDGGKQYNKNFERALKNSGNEFTKVSHEILADVKDMFDMPNEFKSILWNIGDYSPSLEVSDLSWILSYLNSGGRILFSGSTFANDIHNVQHSTTGQFFFRNYLDVNFMSDSVNVKTLSSVYNNPLFDSLNVSLNSSYGNYHEGVASRKGDSHMVLRFDGTDNYGLVLREKNSYKIAYITFGLEQINSEASQDLIVDKILDWFATPVVSVTESENSKNIPSKFSLEQNYPNPFNPSTQISYSLPISGNVKIVVHDILGKEVAQLVNENKESGSYSIMFNAKDLTSGIYFYSISSGSYYEVKKMLLIK